MKRKLTTKIRILAAALRGADLHMCASASIIRMLESDKPDEEKGWAWDIVIMKFGEFKNAAGERGHTYKFPKAAAEASLQVFEGAKVYSNSEGDLAGHKSNANEKVVKDIIGVVTSVRVTETELVGRLNLYRGTGASIRENLMGAVKDGIPIPYELSIDAYGPVEETVEGTSKVVTATSYTRVSVDLVERGAAGGLIVHMAASHITEQGVVSMTPTKKGILWLFTVLFPMYLEQKNVDYLKVDENELFTHLLEADKAQPTMKLPDGSQLSEQLVNDQVKRFREAMLKTDDDFQKQMLSKVDKLVEKVAAADPPAQQPAPAQLSKVDIANDPVIKQMQIQMAATEQRFCETLLNSKLNEIENVAFKEHVREQFTDANGKVKPFQESELVQFIDRTRTTLGKITGGKALGSMGLDIKPGQDELDKITLGLRGFFLCTDPLNPLSAQEKKDILQGVTPYRSIKQAYIDYTGDVDVTGLKNKSRRFTESLMTTDWAQIVQDCMNLRMARDYPQLNLGTWRQIASVVPLSSFLPQHVVRYGGYGDLPTVAQGAPYLPLTSPDDEEATYTPFKKGGTEDLTLEMIKDDRVGATIKIPQRLNRSAVRTLHKFVFNLVNPAVNAVIYDGLALYHSTHANLGTVALGTAGTLGAARLRMKKQTETGSLEAIGLRGGYLLHPSDLEEEAYKQLTPAYAQTNPTPAFMQVQSIVPIGVDYWTDTNNFALVAKREDGTGVEIGFMDGKEEPEVFVSDLANTGSWFTNDKIVYKIRHIFGGAVTDYRYFDGSVVA